MGLSVFIRGRRRRPVKDVCRVVRATGVISRGVFGLEFRMIKVIKKFKQNETLVKVAPWFAGASLGLCHVAMSSNCSVTREGHCTSCGSCVIALGALVGWAIMDKGSQKQALNPGTKFRE